MKPLSYSALGLACSLAVALTLTGCTVGPDYVEPSLSTPIPDAYKEGGAGAIPWKPAQPNDAVARGASWEVYHDPKLNTLEERVAISNQNVLVAEAQYREARAAVRVANAAFYPAVSFDPSAKKSGGTEGKPITSSYALPLQLSYLVDVWGQIRRTAEQNTTAAQASEALLQNARLSFQAELAIDWFSLEANDAQQAVLTQTVASYEKYLQLTQNLYKSGVDSKQNVAQAQAQLDQARVSLIDLAIARAQFEHAIAILTGRPPAALSIPPTPLLAGVIPPPIPAGLPSDLLERRPDIANAERDVASANAAIGIATAGYYPQIMLSGSAGPQSISLMNLFTWPTVVWSFGTTLTTPIFNAGMTHAQVVRARAVWEASVATYRQTVLTAFQQIEDDLAGLHYLGKEADAERDAVAAANESLRIATNAYRAGVQSYLQVIVAQTTALSNELNEVNIRGRRMTTSVLLLEALGGNWDASQLPSTEEVSVLPQPQK